MKFLFPVFKTFGLGEGTVFYSQYHWLPTAGFQTENQTIKSHLQRRGTYLTCPAVSETRKSAPPGRSSIPRTWPGHRLRRGRAPRAAGPERPPLPATRDASHSPGAALPPPPLCPASFHGRSSQQEPGGGCQKVQELETLGEAGSPREEAVRAPQSPRGAATPRERPSPRLAFRSEAGPGSAHS